MPDEDTLSELWARDPFQYTDQDLDRCVEYYRTRYQSFSVTGKATAETPKVDLKDLGLL